MKIDRAAPSESNDDRALRLHKVYRGKIQTVAKCPLTSQADLAVWYTPGVAAPSRAIYRNPSLAYDYTNKGNTVAIVTDGSRVLGLGNIGPLAAMPVMEGKALLFKHFGAVDAVPVCLDTQDPAAIIAIVKAIAPSFGGINLEDIATPKCFGILDELRSSLSIPVWHDDQQGTAAVVLAGLLNALEVAGKHLSEVKIALIGIGAANMAVYRLLRAEGVAPAAFIACDSRGTLHTGRTDIETRQHELAEKWSVCKETNPERICGSIPEALAGADVCIAFSKSGPDVIAPEAVRSMARDAVVFACANPVPEMWPDVAIEAGARVVATGRSDLPNQVNNSSIFPGLFRGVLDVRASSITDGMARAAAHALARCARGAGPYETSILPLTDDPAAAAEVAAAVGEQAQIEGIASLAVGHDELLRGAIQRIRAARETNRLAAVHNFAEAESNNKPGS
ncbi:MAG: NADP-dependent malic enzyme [Rhodomicrobium sp.]